MTSYLFFFLTQLYPAESPYGILTIKDVLPSLENPLSGWKQRKKKIAERERKWRIYKSR